MVRASTQPGAAEPAGAADRPLEGKESRFGTTGSVLWTVTTTAASNGSVNAMHDSLNPLTGMVAMVNMMVGEVIFGGVGAGLYGMLLFVLIAVFLAGLMIGRTPEYLGKKLQAREVQLLVATLLVMPVGVLVLGAIAASLPGPARRSPTRARMVSASCCTPTPRARPTTARRSPALAPIRCTTT